MSQPPVYNLRLFAPGSYAMAKFSMPDFNVEAIYNLTAKGAGYACDCPASQRTVKTRPCKHQRMLRFMLGAVNTERFYEPDSGRWIEPLALMRNGDSDGLTQEGAVTGRFDRGGHIEELTEAQAKSRLEAEGISPKEAIYGFALEPPAASPPEPQAQAPEAGPSRQPPAPTFVRRI